VTGGCDYELSRRPFLDAHQGQPASRALDCAIEAALQEQPMTSNRKTSKRSMKQLAWFAAAWMCATSALVAAGLAEGRQADAAAHAAEPLPIGKAVG
jgi:NADPH-dependent glutamate synthase beta subunit-like oxidoreductase